MYRLCSRFGHHQMWASARWSWVAHFCFSLDLSGCNKHVKIFRVEILKNTQCLFPRSKAQPLICFQIHDRFDLFHESLAQTVLCSFPSVPGFHCCWLLQHLRDMNSSSAWWMESTPKTGCCLCLWSMQGSSVLIIPAHCLCSVTNI